MSMRKVVTIGQHQGKCGRLVWVFQTGGSDSVTILMILCDSGEVIHVQSSWTKVLLEETVPK
jgi:hypothetical protein